MTLERFMNSSLLTPLVFILLIYLTSLSVYRLLLHPLANFPGPKLAALTRYYEAYYDYVQNGQYTFIIAELHNEYGTLASFISLECALTPTSRSNHKDQPL